MICSSKTKCGVFSEHLLFLFLICFKIWGFVAAKEKINRQTENTFHFRDMDEFKKSNFTNRPRLRYYKAIPRKISSPHVAKMNGIVNTSKSQISPMNAYLFKKKLPNARNYYSTLNHHIPHYLQTNNMTAHNENNLHKSMVNKRPASNLLPSQLLNLFWRQNNANEKDAIERKFKKSLANQNFYHDFSRIQKSNIGDVHKINSNIEATAISPGVFYKKYFSKQNHKSNLNSKFKKMSSRLKERRILNTTANSPSAINQFTNIKMISQTAHQKYLFPRRKNSIELFENNHIMNPVMTDVEKLSKNQKNNNLKTRNIIHLKKKTITMEWNNKKNGANKNSEKLRKLFDVFQIMANNNEKIKANYEDGKNINEENERISSTEIEKAESFIGPFYSFRNQNENFTDSNNEKYKNVSYEISPKKIPKDKDFGYKLNSFHNHRSINLTAGDNGISEFIVKYSEKNALPECENDSDVLKNIEFASPIAESVLNWGIKTNFSRDINFIENSDSIKPKGNIVLRKNNEKSSIQLKIEKFERNNLIEPDHLETHSLTITKQKGQTQFPMGAVSLIVMVLTSLTLIVLFLSCCSFLTTSKRRTTFNYQRRKPLMKFFLSKFAFSKKRIKSEKNLVVLNTESPETTNVKTTIHYERKTTPPNSDRKYHRKEIFEISKSNTQESFEENNSNEYEDFQKDSTSDIKIDLQDANVFNHLQQSNNVRDLNNVRRKCDSVQEIYSPSNQESSTYIEKESVLTPTTFSRKDCEKHPEMSENMNCTSPNSFQTDETENRIGSPWNWLLKNVKVIHSFKETQCEEVNQGNFMDYQNNLSESIIRENIRKDAHPKEGRTLKCLLPECDHCQFEIVQESEAESILKQDEFLTKEIVHGYNCENSIGTYEQMRNLSKFSYPLNSKTNSDLSRENLINVKTKSVISLDKNSTVCDLKHISKINSNSQSQMPSDQVDQKITSISNLRTNNEVNFTDTDVLLQTINAKTVIKKDICISPVINSDSRAAKYIVKNKQIVSDLSEQNQSHTSTSTYYPNSPES